MPRYRFQIALRGEVIEDHEGIELAHRAAAIEHALTDDDPGVLLSEDERDAVLAVLADPPQSLIHLRIALTRDQRKRAV